MKLVAALSLLPLSLKVAPREGKYFKSESYYGAGSFCFATIRDMADRIPRIHSCFAPMWQCWYSAACRIASLHRRRRDVRPNSRINRDGIVGLRSDGTDERSFRDHRHGAALGFLASAYTFYQFVIKMSWQRAVTCDLAVGVALGCKHNAVLLLPILLLLAAGELSGRWLRDRRFPGRFCFEMCGGMAAIAVVALTAL